MFPTRPTRFSSPARRALILAGLPVLLALGAAQSAIAQNVPAEHLSGPGHRGHHGYVGPIAPAFLRDSVGVTGSKLAQYTRSYDSHMAATKPARDSLAAAMGSARSAFQNGDSAVAREQRQAIKRQSQALAKTDQQFEASLKKLLTKDQLTRYDKWREDQMKLARARWHRTRADHDRDEAKPQG